MLEAIPADEVDRDGEALAVRYKADRTQPGLLAVTIALHRTEGDEAHVRRSELVLVAIAEPMTRMAMEIRVRAEAAGRGINRVAWIEEG
jgi:hypothetical protein